MSDTETHSPSFPKFLKQLLFVFNGAAKKEKRKENSTFLKHYKRPTDEKQGSRLERILGKGSLNFGTKTPQQKEENKRIALGDTGKQK